jgi:hypothetical protein
MGEDHKNQANSEGGGEVFAGKDPKPALKVDSKAQSGTVSTDAAAKQASAAGWGHVFQSAMGHLKGNLPYAAAGGALGAALPFVEAGGSHADDLRSQIQQLEGEQGEGGFGKALQLAQTKMRLAAADLTREHPGAMSAMGGVVGGIAGGMLGPHIMEGFKTLPGKLRGDVAE